MNQSLTLILKFLSPLFLIKSTDVALMIGSITSYYLGKNPSAHSITLNWTQGSGGKDAYICAVIITLLYLSCFSTASCTLHNHHSVVLDSFSQCRLVLKYWQLTSLLQHVFVHINILMLFSVLIQVILTCWDRFLYHTNKYYFVKPTQTPE